MNFGVDYKQDVRKDTESYRSTHETSRSSLLSKMHGSRARSKRSKIDPARRIIIRENCRELSFQCKTSFDTNAPSRTKLMIKEPQTVV